MNHTGTPRADVSMPTRMDAANSIISVQFVWTANWIDSGKTSRISLQDNASAKTSIAHSKEQAPQQLESVRAYCDPDVYCRRNRNDESRLVEPFGRLRDDSVLGSTCCSVVVHRFRRFVARRCLSGVV